MQAGVTLRFQRGAFHTSIPSSPQARGQVSVDSTSGIKSRLHEEGEFYPNLYGKELNDLIQSQKELLNVGNRQAIRKDYNGSKALTNGRAKRSYSCIHKVRGDVDCPFTYQVW